MMEEEGSQSFEQIAKALSARREETTPNPPFHDEKSEFDEEAPSVAQRRLALEFYRDIASLVGRQHGMYPTPLEITELHQLHLEAIRKSVAQSEVVPEYTLTHVIGAGKRLLAHAETGYDASNEAEGQDRNILTGLAFVLEDAAQLEEIDYPLVLQRNALALQHHLWEEAKVYLTKTHPHYTHPFVQSDAKATYLRCFPEEHPNEAGRKIAYHRVLGLEGELHGVRQTASVLPKRYGVKEALTYVTKFGYDDSIPHSLENVYGASKRELLSRDIQHRWNDAARDAFAANKLLHQAMTERYRS